MPLDLVAAKDVLAALRGRGRFGAQSNVYYVSSVSGSSSADGSVTSPISKLKNLIARLVSQSRSGKNDVIFVDQAHQEILAAPTGNTDPSLDFSLAGLSVIGQFDCNTYGSAVNTGGAQASTFGRAPLFSPRCKASQNGSGHVRISAQGVLLENLRFNAPSDVSAPTRVVLVDDGGAASCIRNCSVLGNGDTGPATSLIEVGHANASFVVIEGCSLYQSNASGTNGVLIASTPEGVVVRNNHIDGVYSSAGIRASGVCLRARIYSNDVQNTHASGTGILSGSTGTGRIYNNWVAGNTVVTKGSMVAGDNTTIS